MRACSGAASLSSADRFMCYPARRPQAHVLTGEKSKVGSGSARILIFRLEHHAEGQDDGEG